MRKCWCSAPGRAATPPPSVPPTSARRSSWSSAGRSLAASASMSAASRPRPCCTPPKSSRRRRRWASRPLLRRARDRPRQAARLEGRRGQALDRRPGGAGQAAQGDGRQRHRPLHLAEPAARSMAAIAATTTVGFEQAIIAAGSEPVTLPFIPHGDPRVIDCTGALELNGMPQRLLVHRRRHHRAGDGDRLSRARREGHGRRADGPDHSWRRQGYGRRRSMKRIEQAVRGDPPEDEGDEGRGASRMG